VPFVWHANAITRDCAGAVARTRPASAQAIPMDQLLLTIPQCCRLTALGRTKFYELVSTGEIPVRKVGKRTLVAAADLKRWAERLPAIAVKPTDGTELKTAHRQAPR
jgi:excisionase family DNA binding protein